MTEVSIGFNNSHGRYLIHVRIWCFKKGWKFLYIEYLCESVLYSSKKKPFTSLRPLNIGLTFFKWVAIAHAPTYFWPGAGTYFHFQYPEYFSIPGGERVLWHTNEHEKKMRNMRGLKRIILFKAAQKFLEIWKWAFAGGDGGVALKLPYSSE